MSLQSAEALLHPITRGSSETNMEPKLVSLFEHVLVYEVPALQEKARQVIPTQKLHSQAKSRLALVNNGISEKEKPLDLQDCLLKELLVWYQSFFSWVDVLSCPTCHTKMKLVGSLPPSQDDQRWGASRVEAYSCESCNALERFPRYNHPGKLLETRRGRCGEWANCFTLLCRAMALDVRYVIDYTDHVWIEFYSQSQGRWLHVDCGNKVDTPLMYEHGWGKKLTYIIAVSKDEVADVTWRYTTKKDEVLKRRDQCQEEWLVTTLKKMNKQRQDKFDASHKSFLEKRRAAEEAELLEGNHSPKESEKGQTSASLNSRLARGETQAAKSKAFTFRLSSKEEEKKEFIIKYSPAQDQYVQPNATEPLPKGWHCAVKSADNIFRKHETDKKMVYLSCKENSSKAKISWEVDWSHTQLKATSGQVVFQHVTNEDGRIDWQVSTGNVCANGSKDGVMELSEDLLQGGGKKLEVSAVLTQGKGNEAWQHTQLFCQSDTSTEFPFSIHLKFE